MNVSYSSLSTFETCPLQYRLIYVERRERPLAPALSFGQSIHQALKWLFDVPTPHPPSKEALLEYLSECWVPDGYSSSDEESRYYFHATQVLELYYRSIVDDFRLPAALEKRFRIDLGFCTVTGVIDRLDKDPHGGYEIIDYKTNRKLPPISKLKGDLQLPIYNLAVERIWGIRPEKSTFHYLIPNQKFSTRCSEQRLQEAQNKIQEIVQSIEDADFEPRENPLCPWCDFKDHCPVFETRKVPEPPAAANWPPGLNIAEAVEEYLGLKKKNSIIERRMLALEESLISYLDHSEVKKLSGRNGYLYLDESGEFKVHLEGLQ